MKETFKLPQSYIFSKEQIKNFACADTEIIDLSNLNLFDTVKAIMTISTYNIKKNIKKKFKYKVAPNVQNFISEIPLSNTIELI